MSNFDQTCERYWPDTRITPGYNQCVSSCQPGSGEGAADAPPATRVNGASNEKTDSGVYASELLRDYRQLPDPLPKATGQTSGESKCSHGFKECKESLNDFKEAEQFMRLKATVLADVNRLEKSRPTKPKIATVRNADVNRQKTGNAAVYSATVGPNRISSCASHECSPAGIVGVCCGDSKGETMITYRFKDRSSPSRGDGPHTISACPRPPPWKKLLLGAGLLMLLIVATVAGVFIHFYLQFARIIDARLEGNVFGNPAVILAAPSELQVGQPLTAAQSRPTSGRPATPRVRRAEVSGAIP